MGLTKPAWIPTWRKCQGFHIHGPCKGEAATYINGDHLISICDKHASKYSGWKPYKPSTKAAPPKKARKCIYGYHKGPHRGVALFTKGGTKALVCKACAHKYISCGWVKATTKTVTKAPAKKCEDESGCSRVATEVVEYKMGGGLKVTADVCAKHKPDWLKYGWKSTTKKPAPKGSRRSVKSRESYLTCVSKSCLLRGVPAETTLTHCRNCGSILKGGGKEKMQWWNILRELSTVSGRIMLVGPPGTGKSQTAFLLLENAQRLTMTEGTAVEDLLGMFHLVEGSTVWKDGPAARAMRGGTALILDEIDKYSPEVGSLLYALLDDDPQVTLPSGEHLKAKAGYKVIATSNANVSALPEAILDRMEAVLIAATPHPDAMTHLHQSERAAVISHYEKKVDAKAWQWTGSTTLRRMRAYSKFRKELKELPDAIAAEAVFGKNGKEILSVLATASRVEKEGL